MAYQKTVKIIQGGHVLAECGPMRLVISASVGKIPQPEMGVRSAEASFGYFERIAGLRHVLSQPVSLVPDDLDDVLALEMIRSASAAGDEDLTPMAAVAGTISDAVSDFLFDRGMTRVVVNNGGDVAVRLGSPGSVRVGIRPDIEKKEGSHVLVLDHHEPSWGIATSGLGGRSLTRGIASAVTVVSRRASMADAVATAVANASSIEDGQVIRRPAKEIEPETDIPELPVTVRVGRLSEEAKSAAVAGAMRKARAVMREGNIFGALVVVQGKVAMTDFFRRRLAD